MNTLTSIPMKHAVDTWPLMSSPLPMALLLGIYYMFVLIIGPRYMKDRKPFQLNGFTRAYNVYQVIACTYFIEWTLNHGVSLLDTWKCLETKKESEGYSDMVVHLWYFIMLRVSELSETVVFVLRKKQNQVSPLHLYHHTSTIVLLWMFLKFSPSEMGVYISVLNCCVHVIMYSYYFLSSYKTLTPYVKLAKPFITAIQLLQLVIMFGESIVAVMPSCRSTNIFYGMIANIGILIAFFTQFYVKSYVRVEKKLA